MAKNFRNNKNKKPKKQLAILEGPRVRFAPAPTGYLHVGGARTALFNWLFARHHQGVFILRIEDTDRLRNDDAMVRGILEGLQWLGLDYDEGPFHQSDYYEQHRAVAYQLLDSGHAYRDFTPKEDRTRAERIEPVPRFIESRIRRPRRCR